MKGAHVPMIEEHEQPPNNSAIDTISLLRAELSDKKQLLVEKEHEFTTLKAISQKALEEFDRVRNDLTHELTARTESEQKLAELQLKYAEETRRRKHMQQLLQSANLHSPLSQSTTTSSGPEYINPSQQQSSAATDSKLERLRSQLIIESVQHQNTQKLLAQLQSTYENDTRQLTTQLDIANARHLDTRTHTADLEQLVKKLRLDIVLLRKQRDYFKAELARFSQLYSAARVCDTKLLKSDAPIPVSHSRTALPCNDLPSPPLRLDAARHSDIEVLPPKLNISTRNKPRLDLKIAIESHPELSRDPDLRPSKQCSTGIPLPIRSYQTNKLNTPCAESNICVPTRCGTPQTPVSAHSTKPSCHTPITKNPMDTPRGPNIPSTPTMRPLIKSFSQRHSPTVVKKLSKSRSQPSLLTAYSNPTTPPPIPSSSNLYTEFPPDIPTNQGSKSDELSDELATPPNMPRKLSNQSFHKLISQEDAHVLVDSGLDPTTLIINPKNAKKPGKFNLGISNALSKFKDMLGTDDYAEFPPEFQRPIACKGPRCQSAEAKDPADWGHDQRKCFGVDIVEFMAHQPRGSIPEIMKQCIETVRLSGMTMEGVYRQSGPSTLIKHAIREFEYGNRPDLSDETKFGDASVATSVLKQYLRDLPQSLIPIDVFQKLKLAIHADQEEAAISHTIQTEVITRLHPVHFAALDQLLAHLRQVVDAQEQTLMTSHNLGVVFGPTLIHDSTNTYTDIESIILVVDYLIDHYHAIFKGEAVVTISDRKGPGEQQERELAAADPKEGINYNPSA